MARTICDTNCLGGDVQCEERSDEPERQPGLALCQTKKKVKRKSQQIDGEQDKKQLLVPSIQRNILKTQILSENHRNPKHEITDCDDEESVAVQSRKGFVMIKRYT